MDPQTDFQWAHSAEVKPGQYLWGNGHWYFVTGRFVPNPGGPSQGSYPILDTMGSPGFVALFSDAARVSTGIPRSFEVSALRRKAAIARRRADDQAVRALNLAGLADLTEKGGLVGNTDQVH
jgi:hypothetical protein